MFNRKYFFIAILSITVSSGAAIRAEAQETEFNTLLFQTTFKIEGPAEPGALTLGTVFLMSRPIPDSAKFRTVLITARHVLEGIRGDTAILNLRRRTASGWQVTVGACSNHSFRSCRIALPAFVANLGLCTVSPVTGVTWSLVFHADFG